MYALYADASDPQYISDRANRDSLGSPTQRHRGSRDGEREEDKRSERGGGSQGSVDVDSGKGEGAQGVDSGDADDMSRGRCVCGST